MPGFQDTIPKPNDDLSVSQGDLLLNNQSINISFGVDHYPFTDLTANDGKHNKVTTPVIFPNAYPATAAAEPVLFAFAETQAGSTLPIGVLQYSRGPSNAVPTPLTTLQSPSPFSVLPKKGLVNGSINLVDFTGLQDCQFAVYYTMILPSKPNKVWFVIGHYYLDGVTKIISLNPISVNFTGGPFPSNDAPFIVNGGNGILKMTNDTGSDLNVTWTIQILRIRQ